MTRLRGRSKRGTRCRMPHGHWKTTSFIGALRLPGITAPMVLDGPIAVERFEAYVEQVLVRTLRPDDVVIMDDLPAHKSAAVRQPITAVMRRLVILANALLRDDRVWVRKTA